MNVLITGVAGFIGSHLADRLIARGDVVIGIDNFATGRKDNLHPDVKFRKGSIDDYDSWSATFPLRDTFEEYRPDVVVHAAASYKDPDDWRGDVLTNCLGGAHVAQLCKEYKVGRTIYFQTSCAYGHIPTESPITPDCLLNPDTSSYAITKTTAERFLKISGVEYLSFRLANAAGARNCTGPIPTFYQRLSAGQPCFVTDTRRDFIDVGDLCRVVLRAVDGEGKCGAYHISTGKDYSIKEIYDIVAKTMGVEKEPELRPKGDDDTYTLLIDPSKTERDFPGWKACTPLEKTIQDAVAWYSTHEIKKTYTHLRMTK